MLKVISKGRNLFTNRSDQEVIKISLCIHSGGLPKKKYEAHFISKTSDADMENSETQVWLQFALECNYLSRIIFDELMNLSEEIGKLLNHMIENPKSYLKNADKNF